MQNFTSFVIKFKPNLLTKSFLVERFYCHNNTGFNFKLASCIIRYRATQIIEILQSLLDLSSVIGYVYIDILKFF